MADKSNCDTLNKCSEFDFEIVSDSGDVLKTEKKLCAQSWKLRYTRDHL